MNRLSLIEEIVRKECERYELERGGFITDREELVRALSKSSYAELKEDCTPGEFRIWKDKLLIYLYTKKNYALYFYKKQGTRYLYLLTRRLMRNFLANIWETNAENTIDSELHVDKQRTIAFKLSGRLFADIYSGLWNKSVMIIAPSQLETQCEASVQKSFPIELSTFLERLQCNDREFWNEIVKVIKKLSRYVTIKQVWVTTLLLQEQVCNNKLAHITSATHLYHSLKMSCKNKLCEYFRFQGKNKEQLLDEKEWEYIEATSGEENTEEEAGVDNHFLYLYDLDVNSNYELSCAIVDILCYPKGELYSLLVNGQEEKVEILMMHIYKQMSYDDIAQQLYGELSQHEQRKVCDNLRQTTVRAKKYLKERMKQLALELKQKDLVMLTDCSHEKV
ncbi:MAG: hypothetical protein RR371_05590 [Bacteroides sp.]